MKSLEEYKKENHELKNKLDKKEDYINSLQHAITLICILNTITFIAQIIGILQRLKQ